MINVILSCDLGDGTPLEATATLPHVPRIGDELSFWLDRPSGHGWEEHATVIAVVWSTFEPERVDVAVEFSGYDEELVRDAMATPWRTP